MLETPETILILQQPIALDPPPTETKRACQRSRSHRSAQELFTRWSNLREASYKLTSHLTMYWPDPRSQGDSLLVNCLSIALERAEKALAEEGDLAEQKAFIRSITSELKLSLECTLMLKYRSGWKPHDPAGDPLAEIIKSPNMESLMWIRTPHAAHHCNKSSLICASRVFTMKDLEFAEILD